MILLRFRSHFPHSPSLRIRMRKDGLCGKWERNLSRINDVRTQNYQRRRILHQGVFAQGLFEICCHSMPISSRGWTPTNIPPTYSKPTTALPILPALPRCYHGLSACRKTDRTRQGYRPKTRRGSGVFSCGRRVTGGSPNPNTNQTQTEYNHA